MANPNRYFRNVNRDPRGGTSTYKVVGGDPIKTDEGEDTNFHPFGEVQVYHRPESFAANVGNSDYWGEEVKHSHATLAKALGVHPSLVSRVLRHASDTRELEEDHGLSPEPGHLPARTLVRTIKQNKDITDWDTGTRVRVPASETNPRFNEHVALLSQDKRFNPETLFETIPSQLKVEGAFMDPNINNSAATLIKLAHNDFPGTELVPSDNLSPHSSKLVKNALEKGLIKRNMYNPTAEVTNESDFEPMLTTKDAKGLYTTDSFRTTRGMEEIPHEKAVEAYEQVKDVLRGRPRRNTQPVTPKGLSDQFVPVSVTKRSASRPMLPGMEGY